MNNFRFTKIIPGVSPTLAKETVLSKIINMVDVFRIPSQRVLMITIKNILIPS